MSDAEAKEELVGAGATPTVGERQYEAGIVKADEPEMVSGCCGSSPAPCPEAPVFSRPHVSEAAPRRVAVVLNPFGGNGRGRRLWKYLEPRLADAGVDVDLHRTERAGHATDIARELDCDGVDVVVVIGGDGSLNEVVQGVMAREDPAAFPPISIQPGGTGNSVALSMGLVDKRDAADALLRGRVQEIDVARVEWGSGDAAERNFMLNVLGWGAGADANETAEGCRCLGQKRYDYGALVQICKNRDREATFFFDGEPVQDNFVFALVQNNQHSGVGLRVCPFAVMDDGLFDVIFMPKISRGATLDLFDRLKKGGTHVYDENLQYRRFRTMRIETGDSEDLVNVDGENCARTPCELTVLPRQLRVVA